MKLALIRQNEALALSEAERVWPRTLNTGMYGDVLATRALVYAWAGRYDLADRLVDESEGATSQPEARLMAKCVDAASRIRQKSPDGQESAIQAFEAACSLGMFDPFVTVYRALPEVLCPLIDTPVQGSVAQLLVLVGDQDIARQVGIVKEVQPHGLSPREREVLELIGHGLSNRAIARALWISESTAKVHVRHIFDKLNVRTRTEAALLAQATASDDSLA